MPFGQGIGSYSRPSLVLASVGNLIQAVYVYSLPAGPIWFLRAFYMGASALMLGLHLRHIGITSTPSPGNTVAAPASGARHGH